MTPREPPISQGPAHPSRSQPSRQKGRRAGKRGGRSIAITLFRGSRSGRSAQSSASRGSDKGARAAVQHH